MNKRDELIFWFDQPPKVSLGAFNHVSQHWGNKVMYIADHGFGEHRKMINWDNTDYADAELVLLSEIENQEEYIKSVFEQYPNAVHIMNGFCSTIEAKIRNYVKRENVKLVVHSEKPLGSKRAFTIEKGIRNILTPFKYKRIYREYKDYVDAVVPLGVWGKKLFESYGWPEDKVFSFMYCPELCKVKDIPIEESEKVRFFYVGRFNYKSRGLDLIMNVFDKLADSDKWSLNIAGGYGDKKDEVINWATNTKNVSYLGLLPAETVGDNMQQCDVYLVPTRADGWNSQINEAINAGVGVICADEAVSDEVIEASGAGVVVKASDVNALYNAVKNVLDNPQITKEWREKAKAYRHRIKGDIVGDYLIDILDYTFYDKEEKPSCPWL